MKEGFVRKTGIKDWRIVEASADNVLLIANVAVRG
jgi:hypothetical protein